MWYAFHENTNKRATQLLFLWCFYLVIKFFCLVHCSSHSLHLFLPFRIQKKKEQTTSKVNGEDEGFQFSKEKVNGLIGRNTWNSCHLKIRVTVKRGKPMFISFLQRYITNESSDTVLQTRLSFCMCLVTMNL